LDLLARAEVPDFRGGGDDSLGETVVLGELGEGEIGDEVAFEHLGISVDSPGPGKKLTVAPPTWRLG
jgi:hypothetical protein